MAWFRRNRSSPSSELDALREENERLRRANGELERRLEEVLEGSSRSLRKSIRSIRSAVSPVGNLPRAPWMGLQEGNAECDPQEVQAKLLEAYDKVIIGDAMRVTKASEVAGWKEEHFLPLAYRLRDAPIPRINYEDIVRAMDSSSIPWMLSMEPSCTRTRYAQSDNPVIPTKDDLLHQHMNEATIAFMGTTTIKETAAYEEKLRKKVRVSLLQSCMLNAPHNANTNCSANSHSHTYVHVHTFAQWMAIWDAAWGEAKFLRKAMTPTRHVFFKYGTFSDDDWNPASLHVMQETPLLLHHDGMVKFAMLGQIAPPCYDRELEDVGLRAYLSLRHSHAASMIFDMKSGAILMQNPASIQYFGLVSHCEPSFLSINPSTH